jgi:hypothetical protein
VIPQLEAKLATRIVLDQHLSSDTIVFHHVRPRARRATCIRRDLPA